MDLTIASCYDDSTAQSNVIEFINRINNSTYRHGLHFTLIPNKNLNLESEITNNRLDSVYSTLSYYDSKPERTHNTLQRTALQCI